MTKKIQRTFLALRHDHPHSPLVVDDTMGPFPSAEAAIEGVRADNMLTITDCGDPDFSVGVNDNWGSDYSIVEVIRRVRPVPVVGVEMTIRNVSVKRKESTHD